MVAFLCAISDVPPKALPAPTAAMLRGSLGDRLAAATGTTTDKLKSAKGLSDGERLYLDNCNACHMVDGRGADGVFPSLVGNSIVTAPQSTGLIDVILHGAEMPSTATRPEKLRMPAFASRLFDADVAALTTFLRSAWGNSAPAVKPDAVAAQRH
jgi:mono/diheme cytochrome c family protein